MWTALVSFALIGLVAVNGFAYTKAIAAMHAEAAASNVKR